MVKKLIICSAAVLMMVACGNKTAQCCDNDTTATAEIVAAEVSESVRIDSLKTDTLKLNDIVQKVSENRDSLQNLDNLVLYLPVLLCKES